MAEQGIITDLRQRFDSWWNARPEPTPGQIDQERETNVSLGLMAQAADAAEPTPEQQIFLSQSEHGMRDRLSVLLGIPHRSLAQEREKIAIEQWIGRNNPPPAPPTQARGFLGAAVAAPGVGLLMNPMVWAAAAGVGLFGWGAWNGVQADRFKAERNEARAELASRERTISELQRNQAELAAMVQAADAQSRANAAAVEAERARRTRTERELRRIRSATQTASEGGRIDYGIPTDGSVRDTGQTP